MRAALAKKTACYWTLLCCLAIPVRCLGQQVIPVWPGVAPGSENWTQKEETAVLPPLAGIGPLVRNITRPTLTVFLPSPATATGTGIIVCPGGAFYFLSWESEGTEVAEWLAAHGIAAFVLKYRLVDTGPTRQDFSNAVTTMFNAIAKPDSDPSVIGQMRRVLPLATADGEQAVKVVREHATEWGVAPGRIGLMGFSAGGMVTMGVLGHAGASSLPDFAAAIYGAGITPGELTPPVPIPLFILAATDDPIASLGSVATYSKWKAAGYPVELHMYAKGGHGFGMRKQGLPSDHWIDRFYEWLNEEGLLKPRSKQ